ncbi:MAG: SLC26A/SulP transporter family protein [Desulfobacterales bacterium]
MGLSNTSSLKLEFSGALSAAIITLPMAVAYGVAAFDSLGPGFRPQAALIGLNAAIFGGFLAALCGGTPAQISGPKAPLTLILAFVVGTLSADAGIPKDFAQREMVIVGLASACVMVGGLSQLLFGLLKMGNVVKYVPHPVVAGFMNGIAILLIWKQLHPFLALERGLYITDVFARFTPTNGFSLSIGLSTLAAVFLSRRYLKHVPSLLTGLLVGSTVYALLIHFPGFSIQYAIASVGELRSTFPVPTAFTALFDYHLSGVPLSVYSKLVIYGVVLGLVGAMESLMSSVAIDNLSGKRHDANRELLGQGVGNMAASFFGALFSAGSIPRSSANYLAGSRSKLSGALCSLLILMIYLTMAPLIGRIPLAVFAGIIIAVGIDLFDRTTFRFFKAFFKTTTARKEVAVSLLINLSVAAITVTVNLVMAVLIGVAISTIYSVVKMSTSVLRREFSGSRLASKMVRQTQEARYLREHGEKIRILELQGPIFFGSADRLALLIENKISEATYCILDMKRVNEIDTTGANILVRLHRVLKRRNKHLLISHLSDNPTLWSFLEATGAAGAIPEENFFEDTDAALEWAEDQLLSGLLSEENRRYYPIDKTDLLLGFGPIELETFRGGLERLAFKRGEELIREGEESRDLYILTRGAVSIKIHLPYSNRKKRLFTFGAGVVFGEMALLDGNPRSAQVLAEENSEVYRLSHENFKKLCREAPGVAVKLLHNIGVVLSHRLRVRSEELRMLEDG